VATRQQPPAATVQEPPGTFPLRALTAVRVLDVERPFAPLCALRQDGTPYRTVMLLVRRAGRPVATVTLETDEGGWISAEQIAASIARLAEDSVAESGEDPRPGRTLPISVIVSTCANEAMSTRCVAALMACDHEPLEVIVVDNRPAGSPVAAALERRFAGDERVRYAPEARVGLAYARNTGLALARGEVVAFTDDDIVVDRDWLGALAGAFTQGVGCVTGLLLPLSLDTPEQALFEQFAGFGKGLEPRRYQLSTGAGDPLFPYAAGMFGSGANTAVRRSVALRLGGFDVVLGAGTPAAGGEDLDMYVRLLLAGEQIAYEPAAVASHQHPADARGLRRGVFSYGVGLTAMLTKQLIDGPRLPILRSAPSAIRYTFDPRSRKNASRGADYPLRLVLLEHLGMLTGPFAYLLSRRRAQAAAQGPSCEVPDDAPAAVRAIDLERPLADLELGSSAAGCPYGSLNALVRIHGDPLAMVEIPAANGRLDASAQAGAILAGVSAELADHARRHGCLGPGPLNEAALIAGLGSRASCPKLKARRGPAPFVSLIVPTAGRPERVRACLDSLRALRYPSFEILIVDNRPGDAGTRAIVESISLEDPRVRYLAESLPGSSVARNRGIREAAGEILAFTDDDVHVDEDWLAWMVEPFLNDERVGVVTGLVMPARLDTPSQRWFEELSGFGKGFEPRLFDRDEHRADDRMFYPYWGGVFGSGNSMAFRPGVLREIGGFDPALGAGSVALAGADIESFSHAIIAGHRLAYEPRAVCWHDHRADAPAVERQIYSYGVGLTAILTKWLLRDPRLSWAILTQLWRLLAAALGLGGASSQVPHELSRLGSQLRVNRRQNTLGLQVKGYLVGPALYLRSVAWARRLRLHGVLGGSPDE
jgi:GT2 family glycosyltransferase